jgi:riboflavin biosynthesis pyrimidine reductase
LRGQSLASSVEVTTIASSDHISARGILEAVNHTRRSEIILTEGGPHLLSNFLAERCLDEQFLTLAPQIAGREDTSSRPGLVMGMNFAPQDPRWARLVSVKRAESHLFLRYAFATMTT